jgi:hypothetical protein
MQPHILEHSSQIPYLHPLFVCLPLFPTSSDNTRNMRGAVSEGVPTYACQ